VFGKLAYVLSEGILEVAMMVAHRNNIISMNTRNLRVELNATPTRHDREHGAEEL
jgi:hypothetical protein